MSTLAHEDVEGVTPAEHAADKGDLDNARVDAPNGSTEQRKPFWKCLGPGLITGLKTFNSKLPCEPAKPMAASLPSTCTQTIVKASHWVGLTLPGMMEEPGSFSGNVNSPSPQRGPEPSLRMSLVIFMSETASVLSGQPRPHGNERAGA